MNIYVIFVYILAGLFSYGMFVEAVDHEYKKDYRNGKNALIGVWIFHAVMAFIVVSILLGRANN